MGEESDQSSIGPRNEPADQKETGESSDESDGGLALIRPTRGMARGGGPGGYRFVQLLGLHWGEGTH